MSPQIEDVIIVGAGPAGLAAAIQLKRYGIQPLLFERAAAGGLLRNANLVENYPGFPDGIRGPDLVKLFIAQAENLHIPVTFEEVIRLDHDQGLFQAGTQHRTYLSRVVVIATGTRALQFSDISIPLDLAGKVMYEVYPLLNLVGNCVVIVGSGDAAFDYGLNLSRKNQVMILNRSAAPKCLPLLWERAQNLPSITYHPQTMIKHVAVGPQGGMLIDCVAPAGGIQLYADYLLGALGREACLDFVSARMRQKMPDLKARGALHIIGDVKNGIYRQTSIAAGDGVLAAMKIFRQLKENS